MSNLETILTLAVWALVAIVFSYYRSLALKQQRERDAANRRDAMARDEVRP
ncbi:MAG: hypothetical protein WCS42_01930 [Verrucomicrobiota bacterium]